MADNAFYNALQQNAKQETANYSSPGQQALIQTAQSLKKTASYSNPLHSYQNQKKLNEEKQKAAEAEKKNPKKTELKPNPQTTSTGFGTGTFAGTSWKDKAVADVTSEEPEKPEVKTTDERDSLIKEYKKIQNSNAMPAVKRRDEIRARLKEIDTELGNGDMDYTFSDRSASVVGGAVKGFGADVANAAGTVVRGMGESSASANPAVLKAQGMSDAEIKAALEEASTQNKGQKMTDVGTKIQESSDELAASSAADINRAKNGQSGLAKFGTDMATNAIQMGMDGLASILTFGTINPLTSMFIRSAGGAAREARQEGATTGQQLAYGAVRGGIEVATEKLFDGLAGLYGAGEADEIIESVIGKMVKSDYGRTALRTFFSGVGEAVEEGISGASEPLTQAIYKGIASIPEGYNKEQVINTLYSMLVGFAMGGVGGGINIINGNNAQANAELRSAEYEGNHAVDSASQSQAVDNTVEEGELNDLQDESTIVNTDPEEHTPQEQAVIEAYQNSVDESLKEAFEKAYKNPSVEFSRHKISNVSERQAADASRILGGDYTGYTNNINTNEINHIIKRHGPNGEHDTSLSDFNDAARIGYVLDNYDDVELGTYEDGEQRFSNEILDKNNENAPTLKFSKKINGTYYVVEAIPESKWKKFWVVTAYMQKGDVTQAPGVTSSENTAKTELASPSLDNNVPQSEPVVNGEQNSGASTEEQTSPGSDNGSPRGTPPQRPTGIKTDTDYNELGQKYGTIEPGENPVRDSQTPKRTTPGSKVSESVRTVQEAEATPESRLQDIQSAVVDGKFSFVPIANADRAANAEAKLKKDGWQKTLREWTAAVRSGQANADTVALGAVLLNNAANNPECSGSEYIDLMTDYVQLSRTTGQALQAARILKTLSPEGRLYALQKVVQNMSEDAKANANSSEATSEASETPEAPKGYSIPQELIEEYRQQTTDEGRDEVIDKIQQAIADQIPSTLSDKFTAIRYLNMLGNLKTQVRNIAGNTGMMLVQKAKNTLRSAIETIASAASGGKYQKQYASLYGAERWGAAWRDIQNTSGLKDTAMGEKKYSNVAQQFAREIEDKRNPFKFGDNKLTRSLGIANKQGPVGKVLTAYNKATSWAMEMGDDIFVSLNYADALAGYMKAHKISGEQWTSLVAEADANPGSDAAKTVDDARNFAIKQAQEATFRDTNAVSDFAQSFDKNWQNHGVIGKIGKALTQGIAPFRKTPANVAARMYEYSPLGLLGNTTSKVVQKLSGSENVTGADIVDALSKGLSGSGLAMLGFALAQAGRARTKSDDDKQEAFDKLRGLQDYSITVGDGLNLTLDWAVPASASLFMGVELYNLIADGNISMNDAMKIMGNLTAPMLEMSMLSGLNDALNNISSFNEDTDALPQFLLNSFVGYISQGLTNTLAGQIEQANEEYRQSYYTDSENKLLPTSLQKKVAQAANKTPGIDWQSADYIDAWGRKQKNASTKAERYANALLNPSYTSNLDEKSTKVDEELQRLYDAGKDIDGFPSVLPKQTSRSTKVNGTKLTPEEYETYATTKGQKSLDLVTKLIDSNAYKALDDVGKAEAISECYSYAKYLADKQIADGRKEEYDNSDYSNLFTGVDKSGAQYDKTALRESNFVAYTTFKIGTANAVKNQDYEALDKLVSDLNRQNSNLKTVLTERNPVLRALSTWKDAGLDSKTYYTVQKELVNSQRKLDKSQKTGSAVELDALANVKLPEATKKRLIDSLDDYGSKTVKGVYDILYDYGFDSKQINDFWNMSQDWVYKDTGEGQSSQKAGTLQPLEAYYAIDNLPGLTDAQKSDIYNRMKEVANVPYKINDWGNYTFGSERAYYESGRSKQEFGASQQGQPKQNALLNALQQMYG